MERDLLGRATRDAVVLLVAATALGFVYNAATPLGVSFGLRMSAPSSKSATGSIYSNETLAIAAQTQRSTAAPNSRIQNETLALTVLPTTTAMAKNIPSMTWPQVKELATKNQIMLVDAREPTAFD